MITKDLVDILACPACKGPVKYESEKLVCEKCQLSYRIEDGIPVLLLEEAEKIEQ